MKKLICLLVIFCSIHFMTNVAYAQDKKMSKKEKKELEKKWKKEAKDYKKDPLTLKKKFDSYEEKINDLKEENDKYVKNLKECKDQQARLEDSLETIMQDYSRAMGGKKPSESMKGLVFKVQLGAYKNFDASASFDGSKKLIVERENNLKRYRIGNFDNIETAKTFVEDLKKLGISDAWVVPFVNGEFVPIEEVEKMLQSGELE